MKECGEFVLFQQATGNESMLIKILRGQIKEQQNLTRKDHHVRLVGHLRVPSELRDQQYPVLWLGHVGPWRGQPLGLTQFVAINVTRPRVPTKIQLTLK